MLEHNDSKALQNIENGLVIVYSYTTFCRAAPIHHDNSFAGNFIFNDMTLHRLWKVYFRYQTLAFELEICRIFYYTVFHNVDFIAFRNAHANNGESRMNWAGLYSCRNIKS